MPATPAPRYSLGLDFGTNSVRALLVDIDSGAEAAEEVHPYPGGTQGIFEEAGNPHLARQYPLDYEEALAYCLRALRTRVVFEAGHVVGIGVSATGSTPIPIDVRGQSLALTPAFRENLNAYAWLWKDHTASAEAEAITALAAKIRPEYLRRCGGAYSSEWFWSKIWHCRNVAQDVFAAAYSWVELSDYVPAFLTGVTDARAIKRNVCAAGHKAMFAPEWGGLPDEAFLAQLHPDLAALRARLYDEAFSSDVRASGLSDLWAEQLFLNPGTPVAVGGIDAHCGAVGAGIAPGTLVKAIGTSTCDIAVAPRAVGGDALDIPGVCGIVDGSVLPHVWGIEAGQSGVGDILNWFVTNVCQGDADTHERLTADAARLAPGQSGLLSLDWHNGNRSILTDVRLTGLTLGQTLHTTQAELYRSLIEALAFGARTIHERIGEYVALERIVACGGITHKNALFMQILADVTRQTIEVAASTQTCALGAAIFGAVAAGAERGWATVAEAQARMAAPILRAYVPDPSRHAVYKRLYSLYRRLHDSFGLPPHAEPLGDVMKTLLDIQRAAVAARSTGEA